LRATPTRITGILLVALDEATRDLLAAQVAGLAGEGAAGPGPARDSGAPGGGRPADGPPPGSARVQSRVEGIVQGVGFRAAVRRQAIAPGLAGLPYW
jgi:hypothetical protein